MQEKTDGNKYIKVKHAVISAGGKYMLAHMCLFLDCHVPENSVHLG
jgi:hypothetical protein